MIRPRIALLTSVVLLSGLTAARSQPVAELSRWNGPARLIPNRGPGESYFRIDAAARFLPRAARITSGLAVRTRLPDGRTETRSPAPGEGPQAGWVPVYVPARAVMNLRPDRVVLGATLVRVSDGAALSNELLADIEDFPTPASGNAPADPGPFGWGRPLDPHRAAALARPGPDGLRFVRVPAAGPLAAFFIATTEISNAQMSARLRGYAPPANRSDEFPLESPSQPAFGLTPERAEEYVRTLSQVDAAGIRYRLPTRDEWNRAARAGRASAYWWGDEPTYPAGANYLGPEPALRIDATAPTAELFEPNPWGLLHTFGNVAEWAVLSPGRFVRLGGHFRTEPPP